MERYRENKVVGRGGFGEAFLCTRKSDAKTCIVKKISTSMLSPKQQEEARHEAVLLEGLSHPCIVGFVESFLDQDTLCIVMDFASCGDLGDYIRRRIRPFIDNFIDEQRILRWFVQITQALEYLHGKNILHRDLKPANIFLTETLTIKIGDFGISKVLEHTSKMANTCIGTPLYMAPELLEERPYDHKADIWGLGCILYEMARLKCPFENPVAILEEDPAQLPSRYSLQLRDLTGELLQKEPDARPSTSDVLERPLIKEMEVLMAGQRPDTTMETVEKAVEKGEKMVHNAVDDAMDAAKALAKTKTWKGKAAAAALSATAKLSATTKLSSKK